MIEKRRYKRLPISLALEVSELFKQNNNIIPDINTEINVFDISKAGIGFTAPTSIPENYYFNATISLNDPNQRIMTVIKILHSHKQEDGTYRYGCEFVGMSTIFNDLFDDYEKSIDA